MNEKILCDKKDKHILSKFNWQVYKCYNTFYARAYKNGKYILMHRLLMKFPRKPFVVDHINHNGLDNRRKNLRVVSQSINQLNRLGITKKSTTGIKGVYFNKSRNKYRGIVKICGIQYTTGHQIDKYDCEERLIKLRKQLISNEV